jgi:hypothetical protein
MSIFFPERYVRPYIVLDEAQIALAEHAHQMRRANARRHGWKDGNNGKVTEAQERRGVAAELAAQQYYHMAKWDDFRDIAVPDDAPDLLAGSYAIDVKSIVNPDHRLISYKIKGQRAYLQVDASRSPEFWINGWLWGHELAAIPLRELQPGRPCHAADQDTLRDPAELRNMIYAADSA